MEKMHSVIEKDEIDELIRNAAEDTSEWIENDAERKDFFKSAFDNNLHNALPCRYYY